MVSGMDKRWVAGLAMLAVVVVLWVASGFFVNALGVTYNKPYLITYLNTGLMAVYLPFGLRSHKPQHQFTFAETVRIALIFGLLWFVSNLLNNASYVYTTVQSATIISCTSSFFTLAIGAWFQVEEFTWSKVFPILMSVIGVTLISTEDGMEVTGPPQSLLGNILALGSAFLYGVYTTLLKYRVQHEERLNTKLFFGLVGLFNIIGMWPLIIALDYSGIERFSLPTLHRDWLLLALNGVSILVSDFCWVLAMLLTSPLVVTVGLSATIPLSMLGEMLFYGRIGSFFYFVGAAAVLWSFYSINRIEEDEDHHHQQEQQQEQ